MAKNKKTEEVDLKTIRAILDETKGHDSYTIHLTALLRIIDAAKAALLSDHVQNNKNRMGALGAMDIEHAVDLLEGK